MERGKTITSSVVSLTISTFSSPASTSLLEKPPHYLGPQLNTNVPTIWAHYLWQEPEHGAAFGEHYPEFQGWGPKYLHPLIFHYRAFLATIVLFTGAHLHFIRRREVLSSAILHLRSVAHEYVQAAINSDSEQLLDSTILAVMKLALFEAIFGVKAAYQIHMQAVARKVQLRQGLMNLGVAGYTARLLVCFGANLGTVTGSKRYLAEELSKTPAMRAARGNQEVFRLGVHESASVDQEC